MDEWFRWVVSRVFHLMHAVEENNFDSARYRDIPPKAFFGDMHANYFLFFERHRADFFAARQLLADDASRDLFDQLILFRILGHNHVRLSFNTESNRNYHSVVEAWKVEDVPDIGIMGRLAMFAVPVEDDVLCLKCWHGNVAQSLIFRQYWFDRDGVRIGPATGDHVLDAGACFGDTAIFFARDVGQTGFVYTFDPLPKHCEIMAQNFEMNPAIAKRITAHPFGLSDTTTEGTGTRSGIDPGARLGDDLPCRTIDSLELQRVDFIKMDIEGSELAALKGGEATIRRLKPKLAISLYHRPEDFFEIPQWIDSLGLHYRLHLDHYSIHHEETVLYAI